MNTVAAAVTSVFSALLTTWPLASRMTTAVPLGTEREATVALFNLWQLWWMADRLPLALRGYLDAPIFFPNAGVTTYTEPIPLVGVGVAPLWAFDPPPALIYNVALLALLSLNGVFAYRLARTLHVSFAPSLVIAVLTVQLPFTLKVLGVLGCMSLFGMFAVLEGCIRFARSGEVRWIAWALAGYVATFLTWQQNALFFLPIAAGAGGLALRLRPPSRRALVQVGFAAAVAVAAVLALALPTMRIHAEAGFERPPQLAEALSAEPPDFLSRPTPTFARLPGTSSGDTSGLFPGFVLLALAVLGAVEGGRRRSDVRPWVLLFCGGAVLGFLLSLGLNLSIGGWRPYEALRALGPVARVRSPFRAAAIFQLLLVPLGALGLRAVVARPQRIGGAVLAALAFLGVIENSSPKSLIAMPASAESPWSAWVARAPEGTVLAHIPFPSDYTTKGFEIETQRMFAQIDHGKPMVNGYSGYLPVAPGADGQVEEAYLRFVATMQEAFPDRFLLCVLSKSLGATHLVIDRDWLDDGTNRSALDEFADSLTPVYDDRSVEIFALDVPSTKCLRGDAPSHDHESHEH